jgi:hypothetical protein
MNSPPVSVLGLGHYRVSLAAVQQYPMIPSRRFGPKTPMCSPPGILTVGCRFGLPTGPLYTLPHAHRVTSPRRLPLLLHGRRGCNRRGRGNQRRTGLLAVLRRTQPPTTAPLLLSSVAGAATRCPPSFLWQPLESQSVRGNSSGWHRCCSSGVETGWRAGRGYAPQTHAFSTVPEAATSGPRVVPVVCWAFLTWGVSGTRHGHL